MTIVITHPFVSGKADGTDLSLIQPSNWNANHSIVMPTARLVGRTTAGTGAAEEISVGTGLSLTGLTLSFAASGKFITQAMLGADSVGAPEIIDGSVGTAELAAAAATNAKLAFDAGPLSGFRNRLINGTFAINQRQATVLADDVYCVDRWYGLTQTANGAVAVQTDQENGSPFNIRLTQSQATPQRIGLAQIVESADCRDMRGVSVALSARLRCSAAATIRYAIIEWTGTADAVTSDVVNNWASSTYTTGNFFAAAGLSNPIVGSILLAANTWTQMTDLVGTLSASLNNAIVLFWTEAAQAQNVTLDISQAQLECGAGRTAFERRARQVELALCQRYYEKSFDYSVAPTQASNNYSGCLVCLVGGTSFVGNAVLAGRFKIEKRVTPTITAYNPRAGGTSNCMTDSAGVDTGATLSLSGTSGFFFYNSGGSLNTNAFAYVHYAADAEL